MRGERRAGGEVRRVVASRYWREADARAVLAEFDASGLGVAAFCRRYGVGPKRIRYWRGRLAGGEGAGRRPTFVPVRVLERAASAGAAAIEIVVRGERTVRVRPDFDDALLRRVLAVLEC
jgi:hypothetical protein